MALVLADTHADALKMAAAVSVSYEAIDKPLLTIQEAIVKKSFHRSTGTVAVMKIGYRWYYTLMRYTTTHRYWLMVCLSHAGQAVALVLADTLGISNNWYLLLDALKMAAAVSSVL